MVVSESTDSSFWHKYIIGADRGGGVFDMLPLRGVGPVVPVPESAVDQFAGLSCARPQSGFCGESVCSADAAEQLSWSVATFRGELWADAFPPASAFRRRMFALLGRDADFHLHGGRLGHISAWLDVLASDGPPQGSDGHELPTCAVVTRSSPPPPPELVGLGPVCLRSICSRSVAFCCSLRPAGAFLLPPV